MGHIVVTNNIVRSFDEIIEIDPYDQKYIGLLNEYDQENSTSYCSILESINNGISEQEYELYRMTSPVFKTIFCNYDGKRISNVCLVEYQTDLKCFKMYIDDKNKEIYGGMTNYAFNNLGMKEVIVLVDKNKRSIINDLIGKDYIPLYDNYDSDSLVPFIKDKEDYLNTSKNIICV